MAWTSWRRCAPFGLVLLLGACGGSSTNEVPAAEPDFEVPPEPVHLDDRAGLNQAPSPHEMAEVFVPRPVGLPEPLTDEQKRDAESAALAMARDWMAATGFGPDDDVEPTSTDPDGYGRVHVKLAHLYDGVPVLGSGIIAHLDPAGDDMVTANLIAGLSLTTRPAVAETDATAAGLARYGSVPGILPVAATRLAVMPTRDLVRIGTTHAVDHTDDFEWQLVDNDLVWEVIVQPEIPDLETVVMAMLPAAPTGMDADDLATELTRRENATRGGNEEQEALYEAFTTAITTPGVRYLFDATTGDLLEEQMLAEQDAFEESEGTGYGYFSGKVPLSTALHGASNTYYLNDLSRPKPYDHLVEIGNLVWDAKNQDTHDAGDMDLIRDWNDHWGDASILNSETSALNTPRRQTPAVDVAYAMQMTWDLFSHVLGRWGPRGSGTPTRACVHYGDEYTDAHYNRSSRFICFGDNDESDEPGNYSMATVGHELGHAFWHAVGNASKKGESSALNEGHGDITGALVSMYRGTGLGAGNQIRRFANFANWRGRVRNPKGYTEEDDEGDEYIGQEYWSTSLKNMPEHVGGLPFARMFVYLAEGAPDDPDNTLYTTEFTDGLGGIGITKAAHIWKAAVAHYINGEPSYYGLHTAFGHAAISLYGLGSMEHKAVLRAFAAIRVGGGANDVESPTFQYAQIYDVDPKDMTARFWAIVRDDTGIRELRVPAYENNGVYTGDYLAGYLNISRVSLGTKSFTFTVEDSAGKTASVSRSFLKVRDRNLVTNGDFEDDMSGWTTLSGDDRVSINGERAFLGDRYAVMEGTDRLEQEVTIPGIAEDVCLVFRVLVRDSTRSGETLRVQIRSSGGSLLETLATYGWDTPKDGRSWLNKGFIRQEFDLSDYAGQTIRIAFHNETSVDDYRFVLDQVALTYVEDVTVGPPEVLLREWENTVAFKAPQITGASPGEILRVDYYVDNEVVTAGTHGGHDYFGATRLDDLGPGAHWVGARVRALDNSILADSQAVWFLAKPVNELLTNPGFEDGAWDLIYSDPPPKVDVAENAIDSTISFEGFRALKMGGQGEDTTTQAGQVVQMPQQMKTLDFSVRLRIVSDEDEVDDNPNNDDEIWLELWDMGTFQMVAEHHIASFFDLGATPGDDENWRNYIRKEISLSPYALRGKQILVRLRTQENAQKPTWFYVDNSSLRWTPYGLQIGN